MRSQDGNGSAKGNGKGNGNGTMTVHVRYGFAPTCRAELPADQVRGLTARRLIGMVASSPQATPQAEHAARILGEVIAAGRGLNIERRLGPWDDHDAPGEPMSAEGVVLAGNENAGTPLEDVSIALSEPYVGGMGPLGEGDDSMT